jgi:signal peptidase
MGIVAPSLRPVLSRHQRRPTIREVRKTMVRATEWVGIAAVILLVAVVALTLIAPYFGWRVDTVRSGSMDPELKVGSVVITRPVQAEEISVGDVITFRSPTSGEITSHRVSAIEDGPSFRTEAVSTEDADPFVTPAQGVVGRICFELPFAGYVVQRLVTPVGILLLFIFGFSIVVSEIIGSFQVRWKQLA